MEESLGRNAPKCLSGPLDDRITGDLKEEAKGKWAKFLAQDIDQHTYKIKVLFRLILIQLYCDYQ